MANSPDADPPVEPSEPGLPFGLGWPETYGLVLGFLLLQIVVYAVVTRVFQ
jgi:hypothetical protein